MTEENAEYTSDWTQNWNGSIAVKLTAIILWSVMVVAFFFTVPLMFSYEEEKLKEYLWVDQQLKLLIKQHLSGKYPVTGLEMHLKQYASDNNIQYIHVESENVEFDLGISSEKNYSFPSTRLSLDNGVVVSISVEHENLKKVIIIDRIVLGAGVLTGAAVFGLFIFIVTRKVVYNPMRKFVRLTHQLSKGENDLRFDEARDDEFGELARFSNEMLDNLELQQARMVETNRELVSEIRHREEALAASQQKSAFLANMSHEIRTPLSSIIGYTERLRYKDIKNEYEKNDMLDIVLHSSNHLLSLINDILDFSKIEANKLEMEDEEFSIIEVITHTISLLHDKAMEQSTQINAEYDFPLPRVIHNDATRIKQVLLNLCGNALRFTQNGVITIIVSFDQKNNQIVIAVKDTGIGMSDEVIDKLFKPFSQADASTSKQFGGTGLGLVISRRLCELMGGDISVKSTLNVGTTFTIRLPKRK